MKGETRRRAHKGKAESMANGDVFPGLPAIGRPGEQGNYQHHGWRRDASGKVQFFVKAWANADGTTTIVPDGFYVPGASPGFTKGYTIVQKGTLADGSAAYTFWPFDDRVGFVDSHQKAEPLVVFAPDGSLTSPGYNPGTGHWVIGQVNGMEVVGVPPGQAAMVPAAIEQIRAAVDALASLVGQSARP